jgi:hypothetical protein
MHSERTKIFMKRTRCSCELSISIPAGPTGRTAYVVCLMLDHEGNVVNSVHIHAQPSGSVAVRGRCRARGRQLLRLAGAEVLSNVLVEKEDCGRNLSDRVELVWAAQEATVEGLRSQPQHGVLQQTF